MSCIKNKSFEKHAKKYYSYYINRFISMKCSVDMLRLKLFPNAKEITESFGTFEAIKHFPELNPGDNNISLICIGDGHKPRTAATFAFRTRWDCYSIDPELNPVGGVQRLSQYRNKIEDIKLELTNPTLIVCPHSHAKLNNVLKSITAPKLYIISIPCCIPQYIDDVEPCYEYRDENIWSPENLVKLWRL